jgi:hypothetical protein
MIVATTSAGSAGLSAGLAAQKADGFAIRQEPLLGRAAKKIKKGR